MEALPAKARTLLDLGGGRGGSRPFDRDAGGRQCLARSGGKRHSGDEGGAGRPDHSQDRGRHAVSDRLDARGRILAGDRPQPQSPGVDEIDGVDIHCVFPSDRFGRRYSIRAKHDVDHRLDREPATRRTPFSHRCRRDALPPGPSRPHGLSGQRRPVAAFHHRPIPAGRGLSNRAAARQEPGIRPRGHSRDRPAAHPVALRARLRGAGLPQPVRPPGDHSRAGLSGRRAVGRFQRRVPG